MQCGQGFSQHENGRCVGEWLLGAQVCLHPGCCSTAPRGGHEGSTLLQGGGSRGGGWACRQGCRMAQYGAQLPAWHVAWEWGQQHGSRGGLWCHREGGESAVQGGRRHGWHVAGIALEPQAMEGQQGCGRVAVAVA